MVKLTQKFWVRLFRALGIGILVAFIFYLVFGDSVSAAVFLLIAYLEYKSSK